MKLPFRLFHCKCNYHLRFGAVKCSYCFQPAPIYNRWWVWLAILLAPVVIYLS